MQNYEFEEELSDYIKILFKTDAGKVARSYLLSRGIDKKTAEFWQLGYCPWGYIPRIYKELDKESFYKFWQKMWGRLIIPIFDQNGKIVSLSGRLILQVKDRPKYDHYPFPSRKILFGLYQNKDNIRIENRCIITEGQMDVISSWQNGLKIVTSSFGAHCSLDHFAYISRYSSVIDVLYDTDKAGIKGTDAIKDFPTWGDLTINLRKNVFPKGEDLDSWIRVNSKEKLLNLLENNVNDKLKDALLKIKSNI